MKQKEKTVYTFVQPNRNGGWTPTFNMHEHSKYYLCCLKIAKTCE